MAEYSLAQYVTKLELNKHDGSGGLLPLITTLSQRIDILKVAYWQQCNDGTGHEGVRQFSQPSGSWRAYNEGVASETPTSVNFREPTGMLASKWQADIAQFRHSKNPGEKRLRMMGEFGAGMMKTFATTILYGDRSTDGKRPQGIMTRSAYNTLTSARVHDNAGGNASATANKTSALIMGFGPEKVSLIHPANDAPVDGSTNNDLAGAGIRITDMGVDYVTDPGGSNQFPALRSWIEFNWGLAIEDERYIQRVANISTTDVDGVDDFSFDYQVMNAAIDSMPDLDGAAIFVNSLLGTQMTNAAAEKNNVFYPVDMPWGKAQLTFRGVPILKMTPTDTGLTGGIINTESQVT
jgi:hypothetical protein